MEVGTDKIAEACRYACMTLNFPLVLMFANDERQLTGNFVIYYVFSDRSNGLFLIYKTQVPEKNPVYPSVATEIHSAAAYEREIFDMFGLKAQGHPDMKSLVFHGNWPEGLHPLRKDFDRRFKPPFVKRDIAFTRVQGEGTYEIPVGPVHAGIIEPGHFRFSVAGEPIINLEAQLSFVHKGIEKLSEGVSIEKCFYISERISGDETYSNSLAFCQALEHLSGRDVPLRAKLLRVVFSELERLANHLNDIGFIMMDTGFSFGGASGARLREIVMQWHERLTGSRFLRGMNTIGGVTRGIEDNTRGELLAALEALLLDFNEVVGISEGSSSLLNRLYGTGKLDRTIAVDHGAVGVAGRAVGIAHDARREFPYAAYDALDFDPVLEEAGDVRARWTVRIREVRSSLSILRQALEALPMSGDLCSSGTVSLRPDGLGIGVTEGWRGAIVYLVVTDSEGNVTRVDVRDPSFLSWTVVEYAVKGNVVPDFPLINKSFNLSYTGYDV
jgi:Ni,Fe-hydrogenase III large subunit/Ni,Fe-hydrogenase III component G